ncbi:MAG TPA: type II CAAX endopeptidase family protein [Candidatus Saccharimonadales bacterium]|nr:type II CAAX endopeptidase family protein [Candidatus Saccharimonadales bacterium]
MTLLSWLRPQKIKASKREIILQILLVFIVPVLLLQVGVIPISWRIPALVVAVSIFFFILVRERWTLKMMHIETKNLRKFAWPYIIFTIVSVIAISFFGEQIGHEEFSHWWTNKHFIYLFLVVSIFQEVAYRGYLIPALKKLLGVPFLIILVNALIFAYMHSIFGNLQINLTVAFIGGLGFAIMYLKYPNLILITLSHAVLNFAVVLYGFFTILK